MISRILKLSDVTFEMLLEQYPKCYASKYGRGVSMPNSDDSQRIINNEDALTHYKDRMTELWGDVMVQLNPEDEVWFDRVKIIDVNFQDARRRYSDAKGKAMQEWSRKGYNTD
jgi:hypothetical protein